MEDELTEAFDTIVSEGAQRLHRTWREVLSTGVAGGLEVATGVLALFAVVSETGSHLLGGLAFSIGFIALLLARSELFTEGFLVPVTAVVAEGLERRGVPARTADFAARSAVTAYLTAWEDWVANPDEDFGALMQQALRDLRGAVGCRHPTGRAAPRQAGRPA